MPVRPPFMRESVYWITHNSSPWRADVCLPALHESVGITRARVLAEFCGRAGVSYHGCLDDIDLVYTVPRSLTAWHLRDGNPFSDGLCFCTPRQGYTRRQWLDEHMGMIDIGAWWVAVVSIDRQVDLLRCSYENIRDALAGHHAAGGTIGHVDYTYATGDGTHTDPRGFPFDVLIEKAQAQAGYADWETRGTPRAPAPNRLVDEMPAGSLPPGKHITKLTYPIGPSVSLLVQRGWLSLASSEDGTARVWTQGRGADAHNSWEIELVKDKRWGRELADGVDQVTMHTDSPGSVGWCLELQPR